jgi:phosphoglycolate phosphatase-like HAD superfamily hydrolase
MLKRIIAELDLDAARSWMLGDTRADAGAARAAGVKLGLVMRANRCELCRFVGVELGGIEPDASGSSLDELADRILGSA